MIYHASLVGQAAPKLKGKIARVLATKAALSIRCDALGDADNTPDVGLENRAKVENRLRQLEGKAIYKANTPAKTKATPKKYEYEAQPSFNDATDSVPTTAEKKKKSKKASKEVEEAPVVEKKRKAEDADAEETEKPKKAKKSKKSKVDE